MVVGELAYCDDAAVVIYCIIPLLLAQPSVKATCRAVSLYVSGWVGYLLRILFEVCDLRSL